MRCPNCGVDQTLETRHHQSPGSSEEHPEEQGCNEACHSVCTNCDNGLCSEAC